MMNPIDKVIEGLSSHYYNTFKKYIPDAVYYLKEYQKAKETLDFEIERNRNEFDSYNAAWKKMRGEK